MRILVVDDHTLFREALIPLLEQMADAVCVIEAATDAEALAATRLYDDLSLIVLDLGLSGKPGVAGLRSLRESVPDVPVVVLSGETDPKIIRDTIDAGARGFIPKSIGIHGLHNALGSVLKGEIYLPLGLLAEESGEVAASPESASNSLSGLSQRQLDVLQLLARGLPNKSIARQLGVSEGTVKLHVSAILRSLGARNRTEAVREAVRRGLPGIQDAIDLDSA
jgi:two-component system nitrate/nitrite response regulator NarL